MKHTCQMLHLAVLGILPGGRLYESQTLHHGLESERFGEQGHLLLLGDHLLGHLSWIAEFDPQVVDLLLGPSRHGSYRFEHQLIRHTQLLRVELGMESSYGEVNHLPELGRFHLPEEIR